MTKNAVMCSLLMVAANAVFDIGYNYTLSVQIGFNVWNFCSIIELHFIAQKLSIPVIESSIIKQKFRA